MTYFQLLLQHCSSAQAVPFAALGQVKSPDLLQHHITMSYLLLEQSSFFSLLHSLRWASGSLVKPDDHRTLHCRCVLNFVSQSLQPAPVSAEIPRNASHLPDGLKKLQTSSRWDPLCYTVRQDQSQTSELQGNAAAAVDSHKQAACVTQPTKPNNYKVLNPSIPRQLQGTPKH